MIYDQDDDVNFLSDKKIEELRREPQETRRRGGAYQNISEPPKQPRVERAVVPQKEEEKEKLDVVTIVVIALAVIVVIIAGIVMLKVLGGDSEEKPSNSSSGNGVNIEQSNTKPNTTNSSNKNNNSSTNNSNKNNNTTTNSSYSIANVNENYNAYPIEIESVVHVKGGNFYNNNDKIKGDKAYVEYKQISGLKDTQKQEKINDMLKNLSIDLYDKNYLSDKDTLFVDITTKISVNFNTLSYVVYRQGQDIDGNEVGEEVKTLNIRLDTLEEIDFEDLFTDNANIKEIYTKYIKGEVDNFYFTPEKIYVYDEDLEETEIVMSKNYSSIAIYKRFLSDTNLFDSSSTTKKVFTTLETTVSEETTDRAFVKNN
ncbi:MAG: hypothetical protein J6A15_03545 [Clostridia bacterium]|nr:hypothetical protein [Clostridia bacterium]